MLLQLLTRTGDARVMLQSEKNDGSGGDGSTLCIPRNLGQPPGARARFGLFSPGIEARRSSQQYPRTKSENRTHAAVASLPQLSHADHHGGGQRVGIIRPWLRTAYSRKGERMAVRWTGGSASPVIYLWRACLPRTVNERLGEANSRLITISLSRTRISMD
ncbi:hypothetical protein ACJ72_01968 [Emergomyces africanus]|uniref:Uncharacterized protein n=1 Tax=Emergomyces africanus TaxID=1955775 RepID=A0A1B7P3T7_9EURO|nr:hypothetical protein ACJ72_01968 [Emergomyces africanus]